MLKEVIENVILWDAKIRLLLAVHYANHKVQNGKKTMTSWEMEVNYRGNGFVLIAMKEYGTTQIVRVSKQSTMK
jgi:hypothetical protein